MYKIQTYEYEKNSKCEITYVYVVYVICLVSFTVNYLPLTYLLTYLLTYVLSF